jgi:hypothetical protein
MRVVGPGVIVLLCVSSAPAGEGTKVGLEDVLKDMVTTIERMTSSLAGIKDEETAKSARPELRKAADHFVSIRKKAETLKPPSKEEKDRLEKEFRPKLVDATKKLFGEIGRVGKVPGGKDVLRDISAAVNPEPKK